MRFTETACDDSWIDLGSTKFPIIRGFREAFRDLLFQALP